jgi:hypothetical protein
VPVFSVAISVSACSPTVTTSSASTTLFTGTKDNIARLLDSPDFELMRHDVTFALYVEVDL